MKALLLFLGLGVLWPLAGECGNADCNLAGSLHTPYSALTDRKIYTYISRSGIVITPPPSESELKIAGILSDDHTRELALLHLQAAPDQSALPLKSGAAGLRYGPFLRIAPERMF